MRLQEKSCLIIYKLFSAKRPLFFIYFFFFWGFLGTLKNSPYSSEPLSTSQELQNVCSSLAVCVRVRFSSVQGSCSVVFNSLPPHLLQHTRTPRACSNPCPWSWWCHPTISSSVVPFSSWPQSFPASGSFPVSQLFTLGGPSTEQVACSVLPHYLWPHGYSWPGSSILGVIQGRMVEWVAIFSSRGSSRHRDRIHVSCISWIGGGIHYHYATWEAQFSGW